MNQIFRVTVGPETINGKLPAFRVGQGFCSLFYISGAGHGGVDSTIRPPRVWINRLDDLRYWEGEWDDILGVWVVKVGSGIASHNGTFTYAVTVYDSDGKEYIAGQGPFVVYPSVMSNVEGQSGDDMPGVSIGERIALIETEHAEMKEKMALFDEALVHASDMPQSFDPDNDELYKLRLIGKWVTMIFRKMAGLAPVFIVAVLCGGVSMPTCAVGNEPPNWIDTRYEKPGLHMVTNAPTFRQVTNAAEAVSSVVATDIATNIATQKVNEAVELFNTTLDGYYTKEQVDGKIGVVSEEITGVYAPRLDALEERTNAWNTAYGWGDHSAVGYVTQELDPVALPRIQAVEQRTNAWDTAAGWGDHSAVGYVTQETDPVALPLIQQHTGNADIHLTQEQVQRIANAVTNEQDLAALRAYHYGDPNIVESPAEWFTFDSDSGTITEFNWQAGREHVVIPWEIGGVPVTAIGRDAFQFSGVVSLIAPQTVTSIEDGAFNYCYALTSVSLPQATAIGGDAFFYCTSLTSVSLPQAQTVGNYAFADCISLTSVSLPQVQTVGDSAFNGCISLTSVSLPQAQTVGNYAFYGCASLTSVSLPQVQTVGNNAFDACFLLTSLYFDDDAPAIGAGIFAGITPNQVTNYVTNPTATGWGATLGGMPVVRLPLHADAITLNGDTITEWPSLSVPYTAWTGTITPANGTATVAYAHGNMPVLVTDAPCVLTLDPTGYGTAGVSRVSLSYYPGTNSFTFATNIIDYSETPTVNTNGWNTLLIRRVSNGAWKGVGL